MCHSGTMVGETLVPYLFSHQRYLETLSCVLSDVEVAAVRLQLK